MTVSGKGRRVLCSIFDSIARRTGLARATVQRPKWQRRRRDEEVHGMEWRREENNSSEIGLASTDAGSSPQGAGVRTVFSIISYTFSLIVTVISSDGALRR